MTKNLFQAKMPLQWAMNDEKQEIIEEIQRRIQYLIETDQISEAEKVVIAREFLNFVENGEKE